MRSRVNYVEFPVFMDYLVHIEITSNVFKSMKKYPQTKDIANNATTYAVSVHVKDTPFSMVFLPYNVSVGTIAHESWHVIKRMMGYCDVDLDSETVAYHLGYLVNKIFRFARGKK